MNVFIPLSVGITQALIMLWPVLGLALAYRLFQFPDITVEGSFLLGASLFAIGAKAGLPPLPAVLLGTLGGGLAGALTAFLHARFAINKFLAGILVTAICYSLALRFMGSSNIGFISYRTVFDWFAPLDATFGPAFPVGTLLFLCGLCLTFGTLLVLFLRTRTGTGMRAAAIGGLFAKNCHLSRTGGLVCGLALTNALTALGGTLMAMRQGFADVSMNQGVLILALAALSLGEKIISSRSIDWVLFAGAAAVVGSFVYHIIVSYTIWFGVNPVDIKLITAAIVLGTLLLRQKTSHGDWEME